LILSGGVAGGDSKSYAKWEQGEKKKCKNDPSAQEGRENRRRKKKENCEKASEPRDSLTPSNGLTKEPQPQRSGRASKKKIGKRARGRAKWKSIT